MMEGPGADSEEKHEPVSDIDTAVEVVGLKALDPEWPIREAFRPKGDIAGPPSTLIDYGVLKTPPARDCHLASPVFSL